MIAAWFPSERKASSSHAPVGIRADLRRVRRVFARPVVGVARDLRRHDRPVTLARHAFPRAASALKSAGRVGLEDTLPGAAR